MAVTFHFPADLVDLAAAVDAKSAFLWAVAREMHAGNPTWAIRDDGRTIAVIGLYPLDGGTAEAWFCVSPAAAPHMLAIMHRAKLTLQALSYREIVAVISTPPGRRMARLLGFTFVQSTDMGELWHVRCIRRRRRCQKTA